MKIVVHEQREREETEVVVRCKEMDEEVQRLLSALHALNKKLTGIKDGQTHLIGYDEVLYFDTADKKTFIYTAAEVFETSLKLYELEALEPSRFFRASKSSVLNIDQIRSLAPDFGGRLRVALSNGERVLVSRQYAHALMTKIRNGGL